MGQKSAPPLKADNIHHILRGASRDIRDILLIAHHQGYRVAPTSGSDHYSIATPPHVRPPVMVFAPKTPSDTRGLHRVRAKLRRIGVTFARN